MTPTIDERIIRELVLASQSLDVLAGAIGEPREDVLEALERLASAGRISSSLRQTGRVVYKLGR